MPAGSLAAGPWPAGDANRDASASEMRSRTGFRDTAAMGTSVPRDLQPLTGS